MFLTQRELSMPGNHTKEHSKEQSKGIAISDETGLPICVSHRFLTEAPDLMKLERANRCSLFPETPHKAFLFEIVIFSQHNDAISLARYQNQCPSYLSSICAAEDRAFC
ncbi:uncharacterized protein LOC118146324 [Callithrix jacchus]